MAGEFAGRTVALVGHCGPDAFALRSAVRSALPGAEVVSINGEQELAAATADVMLVNRVLDGGFSNQSGLDLISSLAGEGAQVMLVSNFPEAQAEAVEAGAAPGFGKSELYSETMRSRLRAAVGAAESTTS